MDASPGECATVREITRLLIPVATDPDRRLPGQVRLFATARHYVPRLIPVAADTDRRLSGRVRLFATALALFVNLYATARVLIPNIHVRVCMHRNMAPVSFFIFFMHSLFLLLC